MRVVMSDTREHERLLFGFGNFGGLGGDLVESWSESGDPLTAADLRTMAV